MRSLCLVQFASAGFLSDLQAAVLLRVTTLTLVECGFWLSFDLSRLNSNMYFHNVRSLCLVQFASDHIHTD